MYFKNPNHCMDGSHEVLMKLKGIKDHTRHPKVKLACTSNTRCKGWDHTFSLGFFHNNWEHLNHHLVKRWIHMPTLSQNQAPQPWILNKRQRLVTLCNI
jgi:hypothetical protein